MVNPLPQELNGGLGPIHFFGWHVEVIWGKKPGPLIVSLWDPPRSQEVTDDYSLRGRVYAQLSHPTPGQALPVDTQAIWEEVFLGSGLSCLTEISVHCDFKGA